MSLKLAERTIQFADTLTLLTEENLTAARVLYVEGSLKEATKYYTTITDGKRKYVLGAIGIAQMQIQNGVLNSGFAQENAKARELFDCAIKALGQDDSRVSNGNLHHPDSRVNDALDMHEGSLDRTTRTLKEALGLSEADEQIDPRLLDNMGTLQHMEAWARMLQRGQPRAGVLGRCNGEGSIRQTLSNISGVRQAQILANLNQSNEVHDLLKQAMASQNSNLNLRAFYTYFLIQCYFSKPAKDLVFATLKDRDSHYIQYYQSRKGRDPIPKGTEERRRGFQRYPLTPEEASEQQRIPRDYY
ncbi:hypothetical protein BDR05DRAFT_949974 [Suillus weaverae]|nr:hypothetical protein BDR05DRAFT_949974 [Suillus weaverae]